MLGRFTFLYDHAHRLPVIGSSREPVRFHVWVSLGVAALAACGVERLGGPALSRSRTVWLWPRSLLRYPIPIMIYIYAVVWTQPKSGLSHTILPVIAGWDASSSFGIAQDRNSGDIGLAWSRGAPPVQLTRPAARGGPPSCRY